MQDEFESLGNESQIYGDSAILICGCPVSHRATIIEMMDKKGFADIPLVFACTTDLESSIAEVFAKPSGTIDSESRMPLAVIFSGITSQRLSQFMDAYKTLQFPIPLWGSRMPQTEDWTLRRLIQTYQAEFKAMLEQVQAKKQDGS